MRPLPFLALVAVALALAGCGSPPTAADARSPAQKRHDEVAGKFAMKEGERTAPGEIPLNYVDMNGKPVDLASYRGRKNVVLVVVKGMPVKNNPQPGRAFCPGCLAQLNSLAANYDEFKKRGAEIVMIFPGPSDALPLFLADSLVADAGGKPVPPFPLVKDPELKAVKTLGIDGDQARPSTYILDKQGNVVFAYVGPHGTIYDRPSVKALLEELDKLDGK